MKSLQELKDRWFVDIADEEAFPPQARYPGSKVKPYTDGNLVEPLIDGAAIMGVMVSPIRGGDGNVEFLAHLPDQAGKAGQDPTVRQGEVVFGSRLRGGEEEGGTDHEGEGGDRGGGRRTPHGGRPGA